MKRILSIILLILGVVFAAAAIVPAVFRTRVGLDPEFGVICVLLPLGGLMIGGAVALWRSR